VPGGHDDSATKVTVDDGGARLIVFGEGLYARHELPESGRLRIGRSDHADVRIADASISREHALLHVARGGVSIEDLGSANGTLVNNSKLAPRRPAAVSAGDVIRIGRAALLVERGPRPLPNELPSPVRPQDGALDRDALGLPIVVKAEGLRRLFRVVDLIAPGSIHVLVHGETGSGKEVVARSIHARSPRASRPFVALNCAAFSEGLLEAELFGHEKGAFTGADRAKPGHIECANGGTLFLDEIADMPASLQTKLLRVLEEKQVYRVGSLAPVALDVRFVSATNRDLEAEVAAGRFRKDLFFRLNGVVLSVPPLRERRSEIEPLARQYLAHFAGLLGRPAPELTEGASEALKRHSWPGNVRELRNAIERAVLLSGGGPIEAGHVTPAKSGPLAALAELDASPPSTSSSRETQRLAAVTPSDLKGEVESLEKQKIEEALEACAGNQTRAAERLGISRRALVDKLDKLGIKRPRKKP
jgi:DNA-binding NtrC family response regulator